MESCSLDSSQFNHFNNNSNHEDHVHCDAEGNKMVPIRLEDLNESSSFFESNQDSQFDSFGLDGLENRDKHLHSDK